MHKITKGLKKKKKNKKHKKEEELFDAAELEKYRREHQEDSCAQQEGEAPGAEGEGAETENDEWKRFKALTAGVDNILKKTQGDLDRIKSTSYFQRKPPGGAKGGASSAGVSPGGEQGSAVKKAKRWIGFGEGSGGIDAVEPPEEESQPEAEKAKEQATASKNLGAESEPVEEEEEDDDEYQDEDIFDTSYVDVVASGELKLAYIPDSPTEDPEGDDPFDTSIAEQVIKAEELERLKKKKVVSLGSAVDVLTGRLDRSFGSPPPDAVKKRRANPRRPQDINLLGSFDEGGNSSDAGDQVEEVRVVRTVEKSLLDDDDTLELNNITNVITSPFDYPGLDLCAVKQPSTEYTAKVEDNLKTLVNEFDIISSSEVDSAQINNSVQDQVASNRDEDELEDEFSALATESAAKSRRESFDPENETKDLDDPFDTFTASAALGIEQNIVTTDLFGASSDNFHTETNSSFQLPLDVDTALDTSNTWDVFDESIVESVTLPKEPPLRPKPPRPTTSYIPSGPFANFVSSGVDQIELDPFDTSFAENILPGQVELRLIEKEILETKDLELNEARILSGSESDLDFNPREDSENILVQSTVSIHITDPTGEEQDEAGDPFDDTGLTSLRPIHRDLLGGSTTDLSKLGHDPIEPANTQDKEEQIFDDIDPFDTSVVDIIAAPGKAELKFLEKEFLGEEQETLKRSISDPNFNPRVEEDITLPHIVQAEHEISLQSRPDLLNIENTTGVHKVVAFDLPTPSDRPDLLVVGTEEGTHISKPLTPYYVNDSKVYLFETVNGVEIEDYVDPFDTSFAENLAPGKAELKLIESELVGEATGLKQSLSDPDFNPRVEESSFTDNQSSSKVETPGVLSSRRFSDFTGDPELKVLESEFIIGDSTDNSLKRSYTDPDFNPRDVGQVKEEPSSDLASEKPDLLNILSEGESNIKPLTPFIDRNPDFSSVNGDSTDIDPFDTSIATDLAPGKAELRVLESELIGK
ncbi:unnamed protein product [Timema podura]|uniref:Protein stoned-A n=1 Tax=Timema podura TaxID=61482 RepID=A0ABN7P7F1_TIMPD|nr:unnamed protein product [Timema podura]